MQPWAVPQDVMETRGCEMHQPWQQRIPILVPPGLACGEPRAGACGEAVAGPFLWWGLLPGALHLLCGAKGEPHHLPLAGETPQVTNPWSEGHGDLPRLGGALPPGMAPWE